MNILIIEDDLIFASNIAKTFEKKIITNRVKIISNYSEFLREVSIINSYDIILVDIFLWIKETKTWIDILFAIREKNKTIPIIIISWYDEIYYLEKTFSAWANDYLVKPFRLKELEIRVFKWFSIYFYSDLYASENINYYWIEYNIKENEFYYNWEILSLTKSNKYLLSLFFANPGKLLTDRFLIEKIWGDLSFTIDRNLRVSILRLKKAFKKHKIDDFISNIRWEWYIMK